MTSSPDINASERPAPARLRRHRSKWREIVLVCEKCTRKVDGGFGKDRATSLNKLLRRKLKLAKGRRADIGVIGAGCFGLCPKGAVTVALGSEPDALYTIPAGTKFGVLARGLRLTAAQESDAPAE